MILFCGEANITIKRGLNLNYNGNALVSCDVFDPGRIANPDCIVNQMGGLGVRILRFCLLKSPLWAAQLRDATATV